MDYNLPDGCKDNDPHAPWYQEDEETKTCDICGGEKTYNKYKNKWECFDCGITDSEDVKLCSMCGDHRPKVMKSDRGYRAECECGVCGQYEDNEEAALTSWKILNR